MSNTHKKIISIATTSLVLMFFASGVVHAQFWNPLPNITTFQQLFAAGMKLVSDLLIGIGTIMIVISGILFLISGGSPGMAQMAKSALIYAVLGLFLGFMASGIADFLGLITGAGKINDIDLIVTNIIVNLGRLIAAISTVMLVISGFFFLFSLGSAGRLQTAKNILLYAIIGIVLGLSASTIAGFIGSIVKP